MDIARHTHCPALHGYGTAAFRNGWCVNDNRSGPALFRPWGLRTCPEAAPGSGPTRGAPRAATGHEPTLGLSASEHPAFPLSASVAV
ncbi:hypothetical protein RGQ21_15200 [Kitasatospora aureofaciens]|nr:hypothetical protein RGQ21_15200 [Kitasatospora aureofaciens]